MTAAPEESTPKPRRALWTILAVYGTLTVLAALMMAITSYDTPNAQRHIDVLEVFLSWPVLGFSVLLALALIFHTELSNVFERYYISKIGRDSIEIRLKSQRIPHQGERPIIEPDDVVPLIESSPSAARDLGEAQMMLRLRDQELERWRKEARRWWHRYLVTFLTPATVLFLRYMTEYSSDGRDQSQVSGDLTVEFVNFLEEHDLVAQIDVSRITLANILSTLKALNTYGLVEVGDNEIRITKLGEELLAFIRSEEGAAMLQGDAIPVMSPMKLTPK